MYSDGSPSIGASDLGAPLPRAIHAVSVSMPRWRDVVAYEEGDQETVERLESGYPRFIFHPLVRQLFRRYEEVFELTPCQRLIGFTTRRVAERCLAFLEHSGFTDVRIEPGGADGVSVVIFPQEAFGAAKSFWQHTGWIVSSRCAASILSPSTQPAADVQDVLRDRLAAYAGVSADCLTLFPSGMAAIDAAHQVLLMFAAERGCTAPGVQYGFPYLDTLKLQAKFGRGVHLLPRADMRDLEELADRVSAGKVSHVSTEVPCNPLLQTPHLSELSGLLRRYGVPLLVDDTIGTSINVDVKPFADIIVTSLTKFISGGGDVAAGSMIVNPTSPFAEKLSTLLHAIAPRRSYLFQDDAAVLLRNCADFPQRMARINSNGQKLASYLHEHPLVQHVYYPTFLEGDGYDAIKRAGGGYGGLLSIVLRDSARTAPRFYDALELSKGPGLGTSFTLACPYTLLAHYGELDWAERYGVSRYLIRVSVGVEDFQTIRSAFDRAFEKVEVS